MLSQHFTHAAVILVVIFASTSEAQEPPLFPVEPILFADEGLDSCEGIGFSGEGLLYATCNKALWRVGLDGQPTMLVELYTNLGIAGIGDGDVLVADFGPTNAFGGERNSDGIVWRITSDGSKSIAASGMGDPNFIVVRKDGSFLVSDDATSDIYSVSKDGEVKLFSTAVNHPNGMVVTRDDSTLYVAQMFSTIRPVVFVGEIWRIALADGLPVSDAAHLTRVGPAGGPDGLALDASGGLYIASNREGRIWRYDPTRDQLTLIAEGMPGIASLVFGEGEFDRKSLYATTTYAGGLGGKIWRIPVGIEGAPLIR